MAKKNTENSTDTTRDQEIAGNTPSGRDQTSTNQGTGNASDTSTDNSSDTGTDNAPGVNSSINTPVSDATPVTDKPGTDTTQTVQADPAANQEQLGVNHNERIGRWKEEAKQRASKARSELDSFINFLDELG